MSTPFDRRATCPNCGAPMTFRFAGAAAKVCDHCRFVVARTDRDLVAIGKMADLVDLPNPLALGVTGRVAGEPFVVEGRVQIDRVGAASAPWQEVLLVFPRTGRATWIAAAQGRWYATSEAPLPAMGLPPFSSLRPGAAVGLGQHGAYTVVEVGQRKVISGEGELAFVAAPDVPTRFADVSGPAGAFGTLDYGDGQAIPPKLYLGRRIDPAMIQLDSGAPIELPEAKVAALACPNCGGDLPLAAPATAERIICRYCGMASDLRQGALVALRPVPRPPVAPLIPLGAEGALRNHRVMCIGFMIRVSTIEGVQYRWREYLLYAGPRTGYLWLLEEDGGWMLATPIEAGDVRTTEMIAVYNERGYPFKQRVFADVEYVIGEFPWKVEIGERVRATEYQGAGGTISVEEAGGEINHTFCVPLSPGEIARAFNLPSPAGFASASSPSAPSGPPFERVSSVVFVMVMIVVIGFMLLWASGKDVDGDSGVYVGPGYGGPSFGGK